MMEQPSPSTLTIRDLAGLPSAGLSLALLALMLVVGLSEGVGILLLIPLLPMLEGGFGATQLFGLEAVPTGFQPAQTAAILLTGFVAIVAARAIAQYWRGLLALKVEIAIVDTLRGRAVRGLLGAEWRTLSAMRQSDNTSLLITTIDRLSYAVSQALSALAIAVNIALLLAAALFLSPLMALAAIIAGALIVLAYRGVRKRAERLGTALNSAFRAIYEKLDDSLAGLRLIKSFGREDTTQREVGDSFQAMRGAQIDYVRASGMARMVLQILGAGLLAIFVWLAIFKFGQSAVLLVPLVALFGRVLMLLGGLMDAWQDCRHAAPALSELNELIALTQANQEQVTGEAPALAFADSICLSGVTVAYREGVPALSAATLSLNKGECMMLSGPSGAGKSTLADVLAGLLAPDAGQMLLDGASLQPEQRRGWRQSVAYVQQDAVLFNASIAENLRWAVPQASDAQIRHALRLAGADFVSALPRGPATNIGDKGHQLSGGERQRIALARALLREPQLLILDEATSAVDSATEGAIHDALSGMKSDLTMLIIGHRSGLADLADRHFMVEAGVLKSLQV